MFEKRQLFVLTRFLLCMNRAKLYICLVLLVFILFSFFLKGNGARSLLCNFAT